MTDDSLYLTNIRLTQFRSFAELDVDLPAEPEAYPVDSG
jgi:exonuclease SbcC